MSEPGELVTQYRHRAGLSQAQLAKALDRSVSWVSQVERGVKPLDRLSVLGEVARALGVAPADLLPESVLPGAGQHPVRPVSVVEAVQADLRLSAEARELLLTIYRFLVRRDAPHVGRAHGVR